MAANSPASVSAGLAHFFTSEIMERHSGRFTFTESRRSDAEDDSVVHGSSNSPIEGSPVSKIGRFAVVSNLPRESEIQDVIKRNKEQRRTSGGLQETLSSLNLQISALIDRNALLEAENLRLRKKCGEDPHL